MGEKTLKRVDMVNLMENSVKNLFHLDSLNIFSFHHFQHTRRSPKTPFSVFVDIDRVLGLHRAYGVRSRTTFLDGHYGE